MFECLEVSSEANLNCLLSELAVSIEQENFFPRQIDECVEKKFSASRSNAQRIARVLVDAVSQFEQTIDQLIQSPDRQPGNAGGVSVVFLERRRQQNGDLGDDSECKESEVEGQLLIGCHQNSLSLSDGYASPCCPRISFLVRNFGLKATARMLLRYETLGTGSLQWGDPVTVHHALYEHMGVRYEGFASPLNSKLLGKPGVAFCSLFPDTDAPFGSLGDFFAVDFSHYPGGWTVNPPFIEELMLQVANKVLDYLNRDASGACWFFVTFPCWSDSPGWQRLAESKHKLQQLYLSPRKFTVQDCYGSVLLPRMALSIFAMGRRLPSIADWNGVIKQCFTCTDVDSVRAAWMEHCLTLPDTA
uniref:PCIF1_WW domain-containing protein n=1 Tax=Macrostomum lignano TaxID=282301 RepID=A0A1I8HAP9_9PLAT